MVLRSVLGDWKLVDEVGIVETEVGGGLPFLFFGVYAFIFPPGAAVLEAPWYVSFEVLLPWQKRAFTRSVILISPWSLFYDFALCCLPFLYTTVCRLPDSTRKLEVLFLKCRPPLPQNGIKEPSVEYCSSCLLCWLILVAMSVTYLERAISL